MLAVSFTMVCKEVSEGIRIVNGTWSNGSVAIGVMTKCTAPLWSCGIGKTFYFDVDRVPLTLFPDSVLVNGLQMTRVSRLSVIAVRCADYSYQKYLLLV